MKKITLAIMGCMMVLSGCQIWSLDKKIPKADFVYSHLEKCRTPLHMKVGQVLRFNAAENASTGYYWSLVKSNDGLLKVQQVYDVDKVHVKDTHVSGTKSYIFTTLKTGEVEIVLYHGQGWGSYTDTPWQCKIKISA